MEASRQSLLAVVPRLQSGLAAATAKRAELRPRPADTSRGHVTLVVFAMLFGLLAPAMVLPSPRNEEQGIIRAQDAARLRRKSPPVVWAGDAS